MMVGLTGLFGDWLWWIVAIMLAVFELLAPGIFFIWLAAAAGMVGVVILFLPMPLEGQLAMFAMLSVVLLWFSRRVFTRREAINDQPWLNQRGAAYVGRIFTLEEAIINGRGKIKAGDGVWPVAGPDLAAGTQVRVTAADGVVLTVVRNEP
ncbi:MAG: NfeD family protein [Parvibaculaceae bacterium]|nr:NfeD family protein [Parvibaculaceae bacterium]